MRSTPPVPSFPPALRTLTHVDGISCAGVAAGIKASGRPDVALLVSSRPMQAGAIFTQNRFAAAPVLVCREHLARSGGVVRAIVVNSGNANACTGELGLQSARRMAAHVALLVGCPVEQVLVCSTGVIGQELPIAKVLAGIDDAHRRLSSEPHAGRAFLEAIMTTDAFAKEAGEVVAAGPSEVTIAGVCKGAGMIHPNMATMLAFAATDAAIDPAALGPMVRRVADASFNAVHVDSHASTNDTFVLLSTGAHAATGVEGGIEAPLTRVCRRLAWLIARDGEGATKVTTIEVRGARDAPAARAIAERVASSALVRTALFGNDPNWGRFVSQVGNCPEVERPLSLRCILQGTLVFERGEPTRFDRAALSRAMATDDVRLELALDEGDGAFSLLTSDLGYRYVEVNAEYTT